MNKSDIFKIDSDFLILSGGMCVGKFYTACEKIIINSVDTNCFNLIYCTSPKYAIKDFSKILDKLGLHYKVLLSSLNIQVGVTTFSFRNEIDTFCGKFNYSIIKGADYVDRTTFENICKVTKRQVVMTTQPPITMGHWLFDVNNKDNCTRVDMTLEYGNQYNYEIYGQFNNPIRYD
jgi:hypothetical protein